MKLIECQIPIYKLFELTNNLNSEYETPATLDNSYIEIQTPSGWQKINALVRKNSAAAKYHFDNGETLTCSTKHLVFEDGMCKQISKCTTVDSVNGPLTILGSEFLGDLDVYDLSLDSPHQYITSNGIIHHNTTLARILIKAMDPHPYDVLQLNASAINRVDDVRDTIYNFVSTIPFGKIKIVMLDEADYLTHQAQAALRNLMEEYASTVRFILTLNISHKIIPALKSRCQGFHIEKLDVTEFTQRMAEILLTEGVNFQENTLDILDTYVRSTYPDLRKCINMCQMNTVNGELTLKAVQDSGTADYRIAAVDLFKSGNFRQARDLITKQVTADQVDELITWAYQNLDLWSATPEGQDQAILIVRKAAVNASLVADPEINISAMFVELSQIN